MPEQPFLSQEIQVLEFVRTKEAGAEPGGVLDIKSLSYHQNACLDLDSAGLVSIWFQRMSNATSLGEVKSDINHSCPIELGGLVSSHFKKYWVADSAQTEKHLLIGLETFIEFQVSSGEPPWGMGFGRGLDISRTP